MNCSALTCGTPKGIMRPVTKNLIVVPCFNEAKRWNDDYWRSMTSIPETHWLFVSDGSTDATSKLIESFIGLMESEQRHVSFLNLERNMGKGEAIRQGWLAQKSHNFESIGFLDADGAFNRNDIEQLIARYQELVSNGDFDAIWSSRVALSGRNIERHASRHYIGRLVATFLSFGGHPLPYDTQSGLKLFKASPELWRTLEIPFATRWLFEIETLTHYQGLIGTPLQVWEMPLDYWVDVPGSKIGLAESGRIAIELAKVKRVQQRSRRLPPASPQ